MTTEIDVFFLCKREKEIDCRTGSCCVREMERRMSGSMCYTFFFVQHQTFGLEVGICIKCECLIIV